MMIVRKSAVRASLVTMALLLGLSGFGLAGCDKGPAQKAGERIDNAAEQMSDKVKDSAEQMSDKLEDTTEQMSDSLEETAEDMKDSVNN